jgi:hypothetical protein
MRFIVGTILLLVGIGTWSCQVDIPSRARLQAPPTLKWVRTTKGWEHPDTWNAVPTSPPTLHPLVVALGQCLTSSLALLACCRQE